MKQGNTLIGIIDTLEGTKIATRFFYLDGNQGKIEDVTQELCAGIEQYNKVSKEIRDSGQYAMVIPYKYEYGMANYSFGCGLSHYLQKEEFEKIQDRAAQFGEVLTFPLKECTISMFTPVDVKQILRCKGAFDRNLIDSLKNFFGLEVAA